MEIKRTKTGYQLENLLATGLPPRCSQVLLLRAKGLTISATAKQLGCGAETVKNRIKDLFYKLKAHNTAEAIDHAFNSGNLHRVNI